MTQAAANWYPDPYRRFEFRYWNGAVWTEHVSTAGRQGVDHIAGPPAPTDRNAKRVQRDVQQLGVAGGPGGGTIFTEPVLVVNQKGKLLEINAEYTVFDQAGRKIAAVREVGQTLMRKAAQPDRYTSRRLQVLDPEGQTLLTLTKPVALVRPKVVIRSADGAEIGTITQKWVSVLGKNAFSLESGGRAIGSLNCEDLDSRDFNIQSTSGMEVGRISKRSAGLAKEFFTKGDHYVVTISQAAEDPLRSLVVAAALAVDTLLWQR